MRLSAVAWLDRVTIFPLTPLLNLLPAHPVTKSLLMPVSPCNLQGVRRIGALQGLDVALRSYQVDGVLMHVCSSVLSA